MTSCIPDFRKRFDSLIKILYPVSQPEMAVGEDRASIHASVGEIWTTFGDFDRITKMVLAAHRFRLGASISADSGFSVRITSLGFHPDNSVEHHPGLGDLVSACYRMGGRKSDAELLAEARTVIESMLFAVDGGEVAARQAALQFLEEVKSR